MTNKKKKILLLMGVGVLSALLVFIVYSAYTTEYKKMEEHRERMEYTIERMNKVETDTIWVKTSDAVIHIFEATGRNEILPDVYYMLKKTVPLYSTDDIDTRHIIVSCASIDVSLRYLGKR